MKLKNKKSLIYIVLIFIVFLVLGSFAYFLSSDTIENLFVSGTYKTKTTEVFTSPTNWTPGDETPKTITTKNEGTIPVRVRVKLDESWTSKNNETLSLEYNNEKVAIINLDNQNDWLYKDGYYYYIKELAPGESTESLLKSVTFNPNVEADVTCTFENGVNTCESTGNGYDGATYQLNITTETVQANKYQEIWENAPIMYDYVGDNPCTFDGELTPGAEYVNGQYTYKYRQELVWDYSVHDYVWKSIPNNGWGVILTDKESTDPVNTTLCSSINNKPIVSMSSMFNNSQATTLDLSSFDTSNVVNMLDMFLSSQATTLDLSGFDTSNVENMSWMLSYTKASAIDLSSFNTAKVTDMSYMFASCETTELVLSSFDTSNVVNMEGMFSDSYVSELDLSNFNTSKVENMMEMFDSCHASILNLSNLDTSNVTTMYGMFDGCNTLNLDLSNFNTSKVTDMGSMFSDSLATSLDLSNFDTSNVTNMSYMFYNSQATSINISSFNTSKVSSMSDMFSKTKVPTLDLSSFDMLSVTNTSSMFYNSVATTGYGRTQADCDKLNASSYKPSGLTFVVKGS